MNIISIDVDHNVRPDSSLILHAAWDVVEEEGFEEKLQSVRNRISKIETLYRTRELTVGIRAAASTPMLSISQLNDADKGDIRLTVGKGGAHLV